MKKSIKNVLSVSALAAVAMMPFAVNAAEISGEVEGKAYTENVTLTGDVTLKTTAISNGTVNVGGQDEGKDITINLNGKTLTTSSIAFITTTNSGTITVTNGTVDCDGNATCISSTNGKVVLNNVTVKGTVSASEVAVNGGEVTGAITSAKATASGTVKSADISNLGKMTSGTFVYNGAALTSTSALVLPDNVNLVLAKGTTGEFKLVKDNFGTLSRISLEDNKNYKIALKAGAYGDDERTYEISRVDSDLTAYNNVKDAYNKLSTDEKEAVEKVLPELFSWDDFKALDETSDQETIDWYVSALTAAMNGKTITDEKPTTPDNNKPAGDETINKNPQTSDSIYSVASLALVGVSALGVAVKKRFN